MSKAAPGCVCQASITYLCNQVLDILPGGTVCCIDKDVQGLHNMQQQGRLC
jgi:hypothetical protein